MHKIYAALINLIILPWCLYTQIFMQKKIDIYVFLSYK